MVGIQAYSLQSNQRYYGAQKKIVCKGLKNWDQAKEQYVGAEEQSVMLTPAV
jgi:hypothetical protein